MKKILVPTDFSDCSQAAYQAGMKIAGKTSAELVLLHSINTVVDWSQIEMVTPIHAELPPDSREKLFPEIKKQLGHVKQELIDLTKKATEAGVNASYSLAYNLAHKDVLNYAKKAEVDFIVMGSHGASGIKEALIGSNAQKVIRKAHCPVLIVKEIEKDWKMKNIAFASDFKEEETSSVADQLKYFQTIFNATLHLFFINTPPHFLETTRSIRKMETFAKELGIENVQKHVFNEFSVEDGILQLAARHSINVIALATHGYWGFRRLINTNTAEHVVNHATTPVLTFKIK